MGWVFTFLGLYLTFLFFTWAGPLLSTSVTYITLGLHLTLLGIYFTFLGPYALGADISFNQVSLLCVSIYTERNCLVWSAFRLNRGVDYCMPARQCCVEMLLGAFGYHFNRPSWRIHTSPKPLPTTVSPILQDALKDGLREAVTAHGMPRSWVSISWQLPEKVSTGPRGSWSAPKHWSCALRKRCGEVSSGIWSWKPVSFSQSASRVHISQPWMEMTRDFYSFNLLAKLSVLLPSDPV